MEGMNTLLKKIIIVVLAAATAAGIAYADQPQASVDIKAPHTAPADGHGMYVSYCGSCHGVDGKGAGPAAAALKARPADLTVLAIHHGGKFPSAHLVSVLRFGVNPPAHGSAQMPVWGPVLGTMNRTEATEKDLRIRNLVSYIESLQVK